MRTLNRTATPPLPGKIAALLRESKGFALLALALYLLLVLVTFDKADPGWSHSTAAAGARHAGGRVGAWLSELLLYLFGVSAYWWVVLLGYIVVAGYRRLDGSSLLDKRSLTVALAGFALLITASSGTEALRFYTLKAALPLAPGGMLGAVVSSSFSATFGFTGATLILLTMFAIGASLFTGISWLAVIELIGAALESAYEFALNSWQRREDRKAGEIATHEREVIVEEDKKRIIDDHEPIRIEAPVVEIPKSERVIKEKQVPLFQDLPDTPLPPLALLDEPQRDLETMSADTLEYTSRLIEKKLSDFGVQVKVLAAYPGPVITRYEIEPAVGVKGSQIMSLVKDLARALSVVSIRVVETIPGKSCMGLEIPNPKRQIVRLSEILSSEVYHEMGSPLVLTLGKDIAGKPMVADLAKMPRVLVAGTTGSGKSVALNAMILSLLYKAEPRQIRLILIDPKMLELSVYQDIPHLLAPVVTDMKQASSALNWCVAEMERRYKLMSWLGVRQLSGYNAKVAEAEKAGRPIEDPSTLETGEPQFLAALPYIVVVIDELADLMMVVGKKVEELIARLAQKARASGIHLILATQRPSVDVITGLIKANIPTRISFQVSAKVDSRTILDQMGAETLLGHGDMLYLPSGTSMPTRCHGAFVSDQEVHRVVEGLKTATPPDYIEEVLSGPKAPIPGLPGEEGEGAAMEDPEQDALYDEAVRIVITERKPSISYVQRRLKIGYNRAARLREAMGNAGLGGPRRETGPREVLPPAPA